MDAYSLGQFLREAREANEIEIADAVAKLRIRQPILESFEAGEFEVRGVPEIQIRGAYCGFTPDFWSWTKTMYCCSTIKCASPWKRDEVAGVGAGGGKLSHLRSPSARHSRCKRLSK